MKFNNYIDIQIPRDKLVELFANPNYLKEYQDGFIKKELIEGTEGQEGAISNMYYQYGKRDMLIQETILSNNLPESFEGFYHHKHMDNTMKCEFKALNESTTRYKYEVEYTRMSWVLPKLMAMLFPGMFKKQVDKWMNQFKAFAEKQE